MCRQKKVPVALDYSKADLLVAPGPADRLRFRLRDPFALRVFSYSMALLLSGTAVWIVIDEIGLRW